MHFEMKRFVGAVIPIALRAILAILVWMLSHNIAITLAVVFVMELFYAIPQVKISFKRGVNILVIIILLLVLMFSSMGAKKLDTPIDNQNTVEVDDNKVDDEQVVVPETPTTSNSSSKRKPSNGVYGVTDNIVPAHKSDENTGINDNVFVDTEDSSDSGDSGSVSTDGKNEGFTSNAQKEYEEEVKKKVDEGEKDPNKQVTDGLNGSKFVGGKEPTNDSTDSSTDSSNNDSTFGGDKATDEEKKDLLDKSTPNYQEQNKKPSTSETSKNSNQKVEEQQDNKDKQEAPKADENPSIEEDKSGEKVEEKEEAKKVDSTPISIRALNGNTAYAGDTVQFQITGEVDSIEGLDGFTYYLDGEYLSIETNFGEATVITIIVNGTNGTSAAADVIINCIG